MRSPRLVRAINTAWPARTSSRTTVQRAKLERTRLPGGLGRSEGNRRDYNTPSAAWKSVMLQPQSKGHTDQHMGRCGTIRASTRGPGSHTGALTDEADAQSSPDRAFAGQHLDDCGW